MRVDSLIVSNFLGCKSATVHLRDLTCLYGANGSGKSSIVDALRFSVCGKGLRGYTLGEMIGPHAKHAAVEAVMPGENGAVSIVRRLTAQGQECGYNGASLKVDEMAAELTRLLRCGPVTLDAALRAGALLEMPAAEMQRLLLRLTGGKLDAQVILAAFDAAVPAAAQRQGLRLPSTLEEFAGCCKAAEDARKVAKRQAKDLEADVQRAVVPTGEAAEMARQYQDRAALTAEVSSAQAEHTAAVAAQASQAGAAQGARAERLRALQGRQQELRAVDRPRGTPEEAEARLSKLESSEAAEHRGALQQRIAQARHELEIARKQATGPAPDLTAATGEDPDVLRVVLDGERQKMTIQEAAGKAAKARLESAKVAGCTHACPVHCVDVAAEQTALDAAKDGYKKSRAEVKVLEKRLAQAEAVREMARAAQESAAVHAQAVARVADLEAALPPLEAELAALPVAPDPAALEQARWQVAEHRRYREAEGQLRQVAEEIEQVSAAAAEPAPMAAQDPAPLAARVEALRGALEAFDLFQRHQQATDRLAAARQVVDDADAVAQACGPRGPARTKLFGDALGPFVAAANRALQLVVPEYVIGLDTDGEVAFRLSKAATGVAGVAGARVPVSAVSQGELALLQYSLQYAVAHLAGVGLLIFDHAENVDENRKARLKALVSRVVADGLQCVIVSCAKPPAQAPAGTACYSVADGVATQIGE